MEQVFVVDRSVLFRDGQPHGFVAMSASTERGEYWLETIKRAGYFASRSAVETDSSRKQIIPYCMVMSGEKILLLRRLRGGGEQRLHHLLSVGVGGHINPVDSRDESSTVQSDLLMQAAMREFQEEIEAPDGMVLDPVGFVNDDTNPVGSVHFGVVFLTHFPHDATIRIREHEQLEGEMVHTDELRRIFSNSPETFETWSQLIVRGMLA